jgi:pimeloyl-ACP methyl ester carboxylesterase
MIVSTRRPRAAALAGVRAAALAFALAGAAPALAAPKAPAPAAAELADVGTFFVGGRYTADGHAMIDQAHVLYMLPKTRRHPTPLVFVPGAGQTITNFLSTPDGRPGWAKLFVARGYAVLGAATRQTPLRLGQRFTATQNFGLKDGEPQGWPQAKLHSQWPGTGVPGDPVFDQFYASQVESAGGGVSAELVAKAGAALLDKIGPAVVITHSQAGAFGWGIGEARPALVKAIVALEPSGPPFFGAPLPWGDADPSKLSRPYGLTTTPLAYDPPLKDPADLAKVEDTAPEGPGLVTCWQQAKPARRLVNLSKFPVLILVSEASYHAGYDHCTARYLTEAGVKTDLVRLPQIGLRGDGHMMMLEKHSAEIEAYIDQWLTSHKLD